MSAAEQVQLSVIVATHNRRELLRRCLDSLAAQTQDPAGFEAIVVDDGSSDGSADMAEAFEAPFRLRVLRLEKVGKPAALNAAIELAGGSACLFLDDDVVAAPQLVAEHIAAHRADPTTLGIGRLTQQPPEARDWYAHAYARDWNERYARLAAKEVDWTDCYGGNVSAPRAALREIGGFATDLEAVEDIEIGHRLCTVAGCTPRYLSGAVGLHDDQKLRGRILRDTERFAAHCVRFARRDASMGSRLLGWFTQPTVRDVMLRRLLIACRGSPAALAAAGRLIPGEGGRQLWFGFVSRYAFWLGVRRSMDRREWLQTTRGVPVLMYHAFAQGGDRERLVVRRRDFSRQMRLLALLRFRVIGFEELLDLVRSGEPLPRRSAAITIDDGYLDNLEIAAPILRRHRFPVTIFLVSGRLGGSNDWGDRGVVADRPLLSLDQITGLREEGSVRFGAHTRNHARLPEASDETLLAEVSGSREDLERALGDPVEAFAYPYGKFDQRVARAVAEAGYRGACTVESRLACPGEDPMLVPRIEVRGTDSLARFLVKLWFGGA